MDRVFGNDGDDIIYAGAANDLLSGGNGADRLYGQDGNDKIYGGAGIDRLYGEEGDDQLYGGADNDIIIGHNGNDFLLGEDGDDKLNGGNGEDILYGDAGSDRLLGGNDNDTLDGGAGNDLLYGGAGNDILNGGDGNDMIFGNAGDDILNSNEGNNTLDGFTGNDTLLGGTGINILKGGDGNDTITSGARTLINDVVATILTNNTGVFYSADTNSFYKIITTSSSWDSANTMAQTLNLSGLTGVSGHLVTITSQSENDFIESLVTGDFWIGASDSSVEGQWVWGPSPENNVQFWQGNSLGAAVNGYYQNWDSFQPTNISGTRDYASIGSNGAWDAQLAITTLGAVIEWEASSLINQVTNITTINGGSGLDSLYGSDGGVDLFVFEDTDFIDSIYNFNISNFDIIDVSSLVSYDPLSDDINDFIQLTESSGDTIISVDADGNSNGANFVDVAKLDSVTGLDLDLMISAENIIV